MPLCGLRPQGGILFSEFLTPCISNATSRSEAVFTIASKILLSTRSQRFRLEVIQPAGIPAKAIAPANEAVPLETRHMAAPTLKQGCGQAACALTNGIRVHPAIRYATADLDAKRGHSPAASPARRGPVADRPDWPRGDTRDALRSIS